VLRAWGALPLRYHLLAYGVGAVVILVGLSEGTWAMISLTPHMLVSYMLVYGTFGLVFGLGLAAADAVGKRRWRPYAIACVGAALGCAVIAFVMRATPLGEMIGLPPLDPIASAYGGFFSPLFFGLLTMFAYVRMRDHRRAARALREAKMKAMEAKRSAAELEMRAANKALEPLRVVRTLREIEALYETDAPAANARLDMLAADLRAAIPRAG
jgi:hypothetical protein